MRVWQIFGNPLHSPGVTLAAVQSDLTGWTGGVSRREPPFIYFSLRVIYFSPVFVLICWTFRNFYRQTQKALSGMAPAGVETLLWLLILTYYLFLVEPWHLLTLVANQESRFFYAAYPAIAVLSARALDIIRRKCAGKFKHPAMADAVIVLALFLNAWWGIPKAMKAVFSNGLLF